MFLFLYKNKKFAFKRIKALLEKGLNTFININRVRRYIHYLSHKSANGQIKRNREIKITSRLFNNLINRNFKYAGLV